MSQYEINHIIDLSHSALGEHIMYTHYNESNPLGAVGEVRLDKSNRAQTCLGTNCQLNAMWSSSEGHLWVVDDHGDVFTNAKVSFTTPPFQGLSYNNGYHDIDWQVTRAFKGQLNGIWGTSDQNVWVTSFVGPVLNWDGTQWHEHPLPQAPNNIHGSSEDDIYVVGYHGNIHHWDGKLWSKVSLPAGVPSDDVFTDVRVISKDLVYITARSGCLLKGSVTHGFKNIGSGHYEWYGVGMLNDRVFLAGGQQGIFELVDDQFVCLKDKGHPVGVFETPGAVNFIPAEQQPRPWFARYEPGAEREWVKVNT